VAEERKVVSVVFCDLVGFTAASESADPEDVDRMLSAYAEMARARIEAHGGVVEKFIGDALVGVFGVPAAHEDDPERAVRAGLRIVEGAEELEAVGGAPLRLRVGVNTGETLVRLGANPGLGERVLAGDAINTASRLQSVAPEMGVAVGVSTYEATRVVFDYEELEPATVKGKAEPVRVFHAKSARARFGTDLTRTHDSKFVGREIDLALLKGLFDKTVASSSVQLVTVVGEPGLGKSRLVAELFGFIDARPALTIWRQGRCLPYGEGVTFWALGEILKAHTGVLDTDSPAVAREKLDAVLPEGEGRAWFRQRLLPLLGIEATSSAEREELFTAWRRFLEGIAEERPTVLVFEDLHWADGAMIAFLEHLADLAEGVPLLLVCTARPELFERHPDFGTRLRNSTAINLVPLTDEETARLVSSLFDAALIPAELQKPILARAGGNPLYAEEFVRLLKDRDLLVRRAQSWELREGAEVPFPESVQALIAARLDTLEPEVKSLLADAAVIGKVFWAGAVAAMGDHDPEYVTATLRELSRKELVRPSRRSSMAGEAEYAFWHILARDVAYNQLPRASRATRHVEVARWIESKATERLEDHADVLAYHYATALELARAAVQVEQASELEAPALRFLGLAGERALGLDTAAALASFERALALTPPGHPDRPLALTRFGEAAMHAGRLLEAKGSLEEAVAAFQAGGDLCAAARAMGLLCDVLREYGDPRWMELPDQAVALLEPLAPGPELVEALSYRAASEYLQGHNDEALRFAEQSLSLADQLGLERPARALGRRGVARTNLGDPRGFDDLRQAIAQASGAGDGLAAVHLYNNLGVALRTFEGPRASLEVLDTAIAFAQQRGLSQWAAMTTCSKLDSLFDAGAFDEALALAAGLADRTGDDEVWNLAWVRALVTLVLALRGRAAEVADTLNWLETTTRESGSSQHANFCLGAAALARAAMGQAREAVALIAAIEANPGAREDAYYDTVLPALVRTAAALGDQELALRLVNGVEARNPQAEHALAAVNAILAEAHDDLPAAAEGYAGAADRWHAFGVVPEQAFALLGQGRCLVALGRHREAIQPLRAAREIFGRLEAAPALVETDALLQEATALSG